jgi:UDP-N-acetylmuramoylalanine--D-glutamate ligase
MTEWQGKRVVIVGLARQGLALARYLATKDCRLVLTDQRQDEDMRDIQQSLDALVRKENSTIEWELGGHPLEILEGGVDLVFPSGGVSLKLPLLKEAQARGIPLSNDSQVFLEAAPCPVIGITGSAGKTTTTTLVGRMAAAGHEGGRVWVGGNIGDPLISYLDEMHPGDLAVMELSSFQLEIMTAAPDIAAVLNITPNHLDRHDSMEDYTAAKAHILDYQKQGDAAVLGRDDPGAWALAEKVKGKLYSFSLEPDLSSQASTYLKGDAIYFRDGEVETEIMSLACISLRGRHNLMNVLAACSISAAVGLPGEAMRAGVEGFTGVPHRLEFVRSWGGADWYNDSIATAPERSMAAIQSFDEPLMLLAGGRDKNLPWDEFAARVLERVDHLILFGEASRVILEAISALGRNSDGRSVIIKECSGLKEAVRAAANLVEPGEVVLLSPGGTSFDEFRDFEERGEAFKQWVMDL